MRGSGDTGKAREAGVGRIRARKALDDPRRNGSRRRGGGEAPRPWRSYEPEKRETSHSKKRRTRGRERKENEGARRAVPAGARREGSPAWSCCWLAVVVLVTPTRCEQRRRTGEAGLCLREAGSEAAVD